MSIIIPKPFDGHAHLREGSVLQAVLPHVVKQFSAATIMPNLKQAITTTARAKAYHEQIRAALPQGTKFTPLMTLYLCDATDPNDLEEGYKEGVLKAAKLYPANTTTHAEQGVTDMQALAHVFEKMQKLSMPLSIHGEVADNGIDVFDREAVFIERVLIPLRRHFPELKIIFEHLSTREAVDYVVAEGQEGLLAGTITAHHLRINRNDMLNHRLHPHYYCMPIVKRESDRLALISAATSGGRMFFAGTDSAPHPRAAKESSRSSSGCFTHMNAMALYAQVFADSDALDQLAAFASCNGPAYYNQPISTDVLEIEQASDPCDPLKPILTGDGAELIPFQDNRSLFWRIVE